jgi:hypothetical protein
MKKFCPIIILLLTSIAAEAGDGDYAVSKIPQDLLKSANAIKRMDETILEISSLNKVKLYQKFAITVLNENGDRYAQLYLHYDRLRSVESIEGRLYDANGKKLKNLKKTDIQDLSGISEISLYEDNRVKFHSFYYKAYPYTAEYEVDIVFNNTYLFPDWVPQYGEKVAVEQSSYSLICPSNFTFHYKPFNYPGDPIVTDEKNNRVYKWEIKNLAPMVEQFASPAWETLTTCVFFSPDKFAISGYSGEINSWNNLGRFQYELNKGRDQLPPAIKETVHLLTDQIGDPKEKIRILYEYLQKNTRYISIQLGIGGFQPFPASEVATKSYGDCKALSNYMYALLKEANIKSCYTEVKSGEDEKFFMPDFPSDQFDHIILCVPLRTDTVWLECTSQDLPAGYLSGFTADRYALAVDVNGGSLVHTPKYGLTDNVERRNSKAVLNDDASLEVHVSTRYQGLRQDYVHGIINAYSADKVKEYLQKRFDFPTYELDKFEYKESKTIIPSVDEQLELQVSNYASMTGKRLFIIPNVMTRSATKLKADEERKYDIVLHDEYKQIDSTEIEIPKGYDQESLPQPVTIETKFGRYYSSIRLVDNKIFYYRTSERYAGTFAASDYPDLVKFYDAVYKTDRSKIVLVKKENN